MFKFIERTMCDTLGCTIGWKCRFPLGKSILSVLALRAILTSNRTSFVVSRYRPAASLFEENAITYYVKSLRGAAAATAHGQSKRFKRYARLHYQAVQFRRLGDFKKAALLYRKFIEKLAGESQATEDTVLPAVAVAHATLNLALTEQAQHCFNEARQVFQKGTQLVNELVEKDCIAHDIVIGQAYTRALEKRGKPHAAQAWLATLLTAWALLETKCGRVNSGRKLAARAAALDKSKARVLRWKMLAA